MTTFLPILVGYLLGALPFGVITAKLARGVDVRRYGSGSTGMTNVMRTTGVAPALLVLALDAGKGVLAVFLARVLEAGPAVEAAAALAALIGHNWSVFIRFRGGKGTATGVGALCALSPLAGAIALAVGVPTIALSRYVSLGSIAGATTGAIALPVLALLDLSMPLGAPPIEYAVYTTAGVPLVLFKHRSNLALLLKGQERKLGESVPVSDTQG